LFWLFFYGNDLSNPQELFQVPRRWARTSPYRPRCPPPACYHPRTPSGPWAHRGLADGLHQSALGPDAATCRKLHASTWTTRRGPSCRFPHPHLVPSRREDQSSQRYCRYCGLRWSEDIRTMITILQFFWGGTFFRTYLSIPSVGPSVAAVSEVGAGAKRLSAAG